jgi:hypothetical protein
MSNKRIRLPREGVVASDDSKSLGPDTDTDVEGHGFLESCAAGRLHPASPSSGGEAIPTDEPAEDERTA